MSYQFILILNPHSYVLPLDHYYQLIPVLDPDMAAALGLPIKPAVESFVAAGNALSETEKSLALGSTFHLVYGEQFGHERFIKKMVSLILDGDEGDQQARDLAACLCGYVQRVESAFPQVSLISEVLEALGKFAPKT